MVRSLPIVEELKRSVGQASLMKTRNDSFLAMGAHPDCALRTFAVSGRNRKPLRSNTQDNGLLQRYLIATVGSCEPSVCPPQVMRIEQIVKMKKLRQRTLIAAILSTSTICGFAQMSVPAMAQITTLTDPYAPGVCVTPPGYAVGCTPLPPVGCGDYPPLVNPGQCGPAPLMPWVTNIPANTIDQADTQLMLPYDATYLNAPYTLGPALQGSIPGPPSAQGAFPDMLQPAGTDIGSITGASSAPSAAIEVQVPTGGVLTDGGMPTSRSGRQSTQSFGFKQTGTSYNTDFGIQPANDPNSAQTPQKSNVGPAVTTYPGQYGSTQNFTPYITNSFYVNVGTGNHTLSPLTNQPAQQIIAPY